MKIKSWILVLFFKIICGHFIKLNVNNLKRAGTYIDYSLITGVDTYYKECHRLKNDPCCHFCLLLCGLNIKLILKKYLAYPEHFISWLVNVELYKQHLVLKYSTPYVSAILIWYRWREETLLVTTNQIMFVAYG